jgi:hypothetical protein
MNVELSEKEYRDLLDILHIAEVVLSGHRREPDPRSARHRELLQKIYALAQVAGQEQLIGREAATGVFVPTVEFEETSFAHTALNEFSDHLFWDELISRLSVRDAARVAGGLDRLNSMDDDDRQSAEAPIRQRYIDEFSTNGIANLAVVQRFNTNVEEPVETSD